MLRRKDGFIYRKIAGEHVVIPIGNNIADFNGIISLNETAAFLWTHMNDPFDRTTLIQALTGEYEVDTQEAGKDVDEFITLLQDHKVILDA